MLKGKTQYGIRQRINWHSFLCLCENGNLKKIPFLALWMLGIGRREKENFDFLYSHVQFVKMEAKAFRHFCEELVSSIDHIFSQKSVYHSEGKSDFSLLLFFVVHPIEPTLKIPY